MAATKQEISEWFDRGLKEKAHYMIVVCDSYDHEDYPVFVYDPNEFWTKYDDHNNKNMQRIMEVYDFSINKDQQMDERFVMNTPKRSS